VSDGATNGQASGYNDPPAAQPVSGGTAGKTNAPLRPLVICGGCGGGGAAYSGAFSGTTSAGGQGGHSYISLQFVSKP